MKAGFNVCGNHCVGVGLSAAGSKKEESLMLSSELVESVRLSSAGDVQAFEHLVAQTANLVKAIAISVCKDADAAADITQQVFIKMWQQLHTLNNPESFLPWLRQITRTTALNHIQRQRRLVDENEVNLELIPEEQPNQEERLLNAEQQLVLKELMDALPDGEREVVLLYYREGESTKQVALLLELQQAAVRKRLQRARTRLKAGAEQRYSLVVQAAMPATAAGLVMQATSAPPVAAATAAALTNQPSTLAAIKTVLLSGWGIGAAVGLFAQYIGFHLLIKKTSDEHERNKLRQLRNRGQASIVVFCALLGAAYYFSSGWLLPALAYLGFLVALVIVTLATWRASSLITGWPKVWSAFGLVLGVLGGSAGLLVGLWRAGRFAVLV